jgi:hypothetical protein
MFKFGHVQSFLSEAAGIWNHQNPDTTFTGARLFEPSNLSRGTFPIWRNLCKWRDEISLCGRNMYLEKGLKATRDSVRRAVWEASKRQTLMMNYMPLLRVVLKAAADLQALATWQNEEPAPPEITTATRRTSMTYLRWRRGEGATMRISCIRCEWNQPSLFGLLDLLVFVLCFVGALAGLSCPGGVEL